MEGAGDIRGCTVASRAYLAHARVLAESFLAHNPRARFSVLIVDEDRSAPAREEPFDTLTPAEVGLDQEELHRRATMYSAQALACSLKPVLLLALLRQAPSPVLYLDADSCVYSELSSVLASCGRSAVLLSPHMLDPHPLSGLDGPEQVILRVGVFNAGLFGAGSHAEEALRWWAQRTARRCVFDERLGLVFDQTWLSLMPLFFEHHILRDRGCNVAGWNLHKRDVEWDADIPCIDGGSLRHFHFAGSFDPERPEAITPIEHLASWWAKLEHRPGAARLVAQYAQSLLDRGYRQVRSTAPQHNLMPDGMPIAAWMRERYRRALIEAEEAGTPEPPNPFTHGAQRFQEWISRRAAEAAAAPVHADRAAVQDQALADALLDGRGLLARIAELEQIRDDAVGWAQRVSSELEIVRADIQIMWADLERERERSAATIESIRQSASWRLTRPLRKAKAALRREPEGPAG